MQTVERKESTTVQEVQGNTSQETSKNHISESVESKQNMQMQHDR